MGTEAVEQYESVFDLRLPVGEVGVGGADSSVVCATCCCTAVAVAVTEAGTQKAGSASSDFNELGLKLPALLLPNLPRATHSFTLSTL